MAHGFRVVDRDQRFLMPPSIDEWVPEDHPVRFVVDAVSMLDLSAFEARYRLGGTGRRAFDPEMMVGLLLWAFSNKVYASREIERRCESDVMFRFVTGNEAPDHATIARFRQTHEDALKGLHAQVLAMCAQVGLVRVGAVFLDGTKLGASASKSRNKTMGWLDDEIAEWFRVAGEADDRDDDEFGDRRGDETPAELARREARRASLQAARDHLVAEQAVKGAKTRTGRDRRVNVVDPDSALLAVQGGGWVQGYNAQAVATADRVVLATSVCAETSDATQLLAMIEAVGVELDAAGIAEGVGTVVADAGYWSDNLDKNTAACGPKLLIATGKARDVVRLAGQTETETDAETEAGDAAVPDADPIGAVFDADTYQRRRDVLEQWEAELIDYRQAAAAAKVSVPRLYELRAAFRADPEDLLGTEIRPRHPRGPSRPAAALAAMRAELASEAGQALYRQRSPNIEGVFADRKQRLGFRRVTRRGTAAAASEWSLVNTAGNLDKARRAITALTAVLAGQIPAAT
jgi:transposase